MNLKELEKKNIGKELIDEFKTCKSIEEAMELASKNGLNITKEEITKLFKTKAKELTEDELDSVFGGAAGTVIGGDSNLPISNVNPQCVIDGCGGSLFLLDKPGEVHDCAWVQYNIYVCDKCYTKYDHFIDGDYWEFD